jgi:hypothetical protein
MRELAKQKTAVPQGAASLALAVLESDGRRRKVGTLERPHVLEAYLAIIVATVLLSHGLVPEFRKNAGRISLGNPG